MGVKTPRRSVVPKHYHRLSAAEKERHNRLQEPPTRCHCCEMAVSPDDLLKHVDEWCKGRPDPHPYSRWISWGEAIALGLSKKRLELGIGSGEIRHRVKRGRKAYLKRDIVLFVAARKRWRARKASQDDA